MKKYCEEFLVLNEALDSPEEQEKREKKKRWIRIGILILLILLLLLPLAMCSKDDSRIQQGIINIPEGMEMDMQRLVNEATAEGMFEVFMNTSITVNEKNEANFLIQNSDSNHYSAYVTVTCRDRLLYKSGVIAPGHKIETDKFPKDLQNGTYQCIATFHVLGKNKAEINAVSLPVTIKKET